MMKVRYIVEAFDRSSYEPYERGPVPFFIATPFLGDSSKMVEMRIGRIVQPETNKKMHENQYITQLWVMYLERIHLTWW